MSLPRTSALLGGTSGRWDTCISPSTLGTLSLTFLYDCFQSVAIIFSEDFFKKNYQYYICPLGKLKTNTI